MEGIPGWWLLAVFLCYGLMGLFLLPAFAAGVLLLAHRPQQALKLFASALLGEAVVWAAFCFLAEGWGIPELPIGLMALSLLLAGSGQFAAALYNPRTYAVVLGFAIGAVLVIVAGPIGDRVLYRLNLSPQWLNWLPDWRSLPVVLTSLALAVASLMIAVLLPLGSRQPEAEGSKAKGPGRTNG